MGSLDDVVDLSELRSFLLVRHEEHEFGEEAARSIVAEELAELLQVRERAHLTSLEAGREPSEVGDRSLVPTPSRARR